MADKRLFVLNAELSGINPYMFRSLRERRWDVRVANVSLPTLQRRGIAIRSFHWNRDQWKRHYHRQLFSFALSSRGLQARSVICSKLVRQHARAGDIVFTFGTLFSPHFIDWSQPIVTYKDYTVELLRRSGWTHGMPASELNQWAKVEADLCRAASLVFTASENTRRSMIDDYGVPQLCVEAVGEGLCFDELPSPMTPKVLHQDVLFVGKGDFQRKGGEVLLAAFSRVRSRLPSARLTIVGPPPAEPREAVRWAGRVRDRAAIRAYYENASVFALPSLCEAFGLAFLEAMAFSLPCIGTNRDAMPEIIEDGRTGFLVNPSDEVVLADRLIQLLEDGQMAARMGRAGYERVMSRFLWSHVAERMDRRLTQLLESQA